MGSLKKKVKKYVSKAKDLFTSVDPVAGALFGDKAKESSAPDTRSEAAAQLVKKNVNRQAGAGQINFTEETLG